MKTGIGILALLISSMCLLNAQSFTTVGPSSGNASEIIRAGSYLIVNSGPGGIFRSSDNGLHWTKANAGLPIYPHCNKVIYSGSKLYAAIYQSGVYSSADFGQSWQQLTTVFPTSASTNYSLFVNGPDIYAGSANGGYYYSPDGGATWTLDQGILKTQQIRTFALAGTRLLAANGTGIYYSENRGTTWTLFNNGISQVNNMIASDNAIYITGSSGFQISRDFGDTWAQVTPSGLNQFAIALGATGDGVYVGNSNGSISYSPDEGQNWTTKTNALLTNRHWNILYDNGALFLCTGGGLFYSPDVGDTWEERSTGLITGIVQQMRSKGNTILASTQNGLYVSPDNGQTWARKSGYIAATDRNVIGAHIPDDNSIVIGTYNGIDDGIYKSPDGINWSTKVSLPVNTSVSSFEGYRNKIVATASGTLYISTNGGDNWTSSTPSIPNAIIQALKGDTIILGQLFTSNAIISKDFGSTWTTITPPSTSIGAFAWAETILLASTNTGLYASSDGGTTWTKKITTGLSGTSIVSMTGYNNYVVAISNSRVYSSADGGGRWSFVSGLEAATSHSVHIKYPYFYVGTYGAGVIRGDMNVSQSITFPAIPDKTFGDANFSLGATSSSGLPVSYRTQNSSWISISSGGVVTIIGAGPIGIEAYQAGSIIYKADSIKRFFCINPAKPAITLGSDKVTLTSSASSTNQWLLDGVPVNGATGTSYKAITPGSYSVRVNVAGCINTSAIQQVLTTQSITFGSLGNKTMGDAAFTIGATASSSLPVSFSTKNNSSITIVGNTVTINAPGNVTIAASQNGNSNFSPADSVKQSFCINPAKPVITTQSDNITLTSSAATGNQWLLNGNPITGATTPSYKISVGGTYAVEVSAGTCKTPSDNKVFIITGDLVEPATHLISAFPNPAENKIQIVVPDFARHIPVIVNVLDAMGRVYDSHQSGFDDSVTLDVSQYNAGMFVVQLSQGSKRAVVRFVKR